MTRRRAEQRRRLSGSLEERIAAVLKDEVTIEPYDQAWVQWFEEEAAHLRSRFPRPLILRIEHFGSTAVPGLAAKPIVDMLIEVGDLSMTRSIIVPALERDGYDYFWRTDSPPPYAWFIKRNEHGQRTHHLHMVEAGSSLWVRLQFRDYIREFPEAAAKYEAVKLESAAEHPNDRVAYTKAKTDIIKTLTDAAVRYYAGSDE